MSNEYREDILGSILLNEKGNGYRAPPSKNGKDSGEHREGELKLTEQIEHLTHDEEINPDKNGFGKPFVQIAWSDFDLLFPKGNGEGLSPADIRVLAYMGYDHMDSQGLSHVISIPKICEHTGLSKGQVYKSMKKLEELGEIVESSDKKGQFLVAWVGRGLASGRVASGEKQARDAAQSELQAMKADMDLLDSRKSEFKQKVGRFASSSEITEMQDNLRNREWFLKFMSKAKERRNQTGMETGDLVFDEVASKYAGIIDPEILKKRATEFATVNSGQEVDTPQMQVLAGLTEEEYVEWMAFKKSQSSS